MDADRTRPIFLSGKLLAASDLTLEQSYLRSSYRVVDCTLHSYGIASGLDLSRSGQGRITVAAGFAFDSAGAQVSLQASVEIDLRTSPSSRVWITIRYGETPAEPAGSARGTFYRRFVVQPVISVRASNQSKDIQGGMELVLGRIDLSVFREVVTIDPSERRISGVTAGQLDFLNPTPQLATIAAGSEPGALNVHSPQTDLFAAAVVGGAVGIFASGAGGKPAAGLEVDGVPQVSGHGTIWFELAGAATGTSFPSEKTTVSGDYTVYGNGTYFSGELSPGDTITAAGATATVVTVSGPNLLTATLVSGSPDPPNVPTPFLFRPRLLARIRCGDGRAVLAVTASGDVGIGTDSPAARLHVASGDVGLGPDHNLLFDGSGRITSDQAKSFIGFTSDSLSITSQGDLALVAGAASATSPPTLVIKAASGNVGIGTTDPADALTVNGVIEATEGFVFPDGEEQSAGVVSIPIGTILDWWQPQGSTALCPAGFQICDGGTVEDSSSPLKGQQLPDLTDLFTLAVISYDQVGKTGGVSQHTHTTTISQHDHPMVHQHAITASISPTTSHSGTSLSVDGSLSDKSHSHDFGTQHCAPPTVPTGMYSGSGTAPTGSASAVPASMYLLKIMRIR